MNLNSNITKEELRAPCQLRLSLLSRLQTWRPKEDGWMGDVEKRENLNLQNGGGFKHSVSQTHSTFLPVSKLLFTNFPIGDTLISATYGHPVSTDPMHLEDRHGAKRTPSPPPSHFSPNKLTKEGQKGYRSRPSSLRSLLKLSDMKGRFPRGRGSTRRAQVSPIVLNAISGARIS